MYRKMTEGLEEECKSLANSESLDQKELKDIEDQIKVKLITHLLYIITCVSHSAALIKLRYTQSVVQCNVSH